MESMAPVMVFFILAAAATTTTPSGADARTKAAILPAEKEEPAAATVVVLPPLPPLPGLPQLPALPGLATPSPSPQPPAHCVGYLLSVHVCVPYLTGRTAAPTDGCCNNFRDLVSSSAGICLCHVLIANPALHSFINGTIDQLRMFALPLTCRSIIPLQLALCFFEPLPPFP